jgi:hypothetical protein
MLADDSHASHKNFDVILFAPSHHVQMLSLPPHTFHKLQPPDRALMKAFKNEFNEACAHWTRKYLYTKIGVKDIASLTNIASTKICRMELALSAVDSTGPI